MIHHCIYLKINTIIITYLKLDLPSESTAASPVTSTSTSADEVHSSDTGGRPDSGAVDCPPATAAFTNSATKAFCQKKIK